MRHDDKIAAQQLRPGTRLLELDLCFAILNVVKMCVVLVIYLVCPGRGESRVTENLSLELQTIQN